MADENGVAVRSAAVLLIAASPSVTPMDCVRTVKDVDPSLPVASPRPTPTFIFWNAYQDPRNATAGSDSESSPIAAAPDAVSC